MSMSPETTEAIRSASAPSWLDGEDLDRHPDVGLLDLVGDDLRAAAVLRLVLGVAVGELQGGVPAGLPARRLRFVVAATGGEEHR